VSVRLRRRVLLAILALGLMLFCSTPFIPFAIDEIYGIELSRQVEIVRTERRLTRAGVLFILCGLFLGMGLAVSSAVLLDALGLLDLVDCPRGER